MDCFSCIQHSHEHSKVVHLSTQFAIRRYSLCELSHDAFDPNYDLFIINIPHPFPKYLLQLFTQVANVITHQLENRMESFFLAETVKYLYLIFDEDNFVNRIPGDLPAPISHISSAGVECTLENGGYVFNTEAHPIDPGALHCCSPKFTSGGSPSKLVTETRTTTQQNLEQTTVSVEDLERLSREEAQYNPAKGLLDLVDSVFVQHLKISPNLTDPIACIIPESPAIQKPCANLNSINHVLIEPWLDLRQFVLQQSNYNLMKNHTANTLDNLNEDAVITDFSAFEPPLLTCPYPPFHQRYTYSGQMVIAED